MSLSEEGGVAVIPYFFFGKYREHELNGRGVFFEFPKKNLVNLVIF